MAPREYSPQGLIVLWQLVQGPMHVYRIQKLMQEQAKDRVINVRSRASLYQTLRRLERLGLVEEHARERDAARPERTVYAITDDGRETAQEWLREMLRSVGGEFPDFIAAVSILFGLAPDDAKTQLEARAQALQAELETTDAILGGNSAVPRLFLLEEEYRAAVLRAELEWVRTVIADIADERLSWSLEWIQQMAEQFLSSEEDA